MDPQAVIGADVRIGPAAVIEGPVTIGPGCIIHAHAHLIGPLTLGARNVVHGGAVIGDWPQDRKYKGDPSETVVGDENVFREHCTIHRGTGAGTRTTIGNRCYFFVSSHVGHNCVVGDDVMLVNGAGLGGHVQIGSRAIIGAGSFVHQFCRVGRMAMITNIAGLNVDMPPFFISMQTNVVTQLNVVGLRRSGIPRENINAIREMFRLAFRSGRPIRTALLELPPEIAAVPEVKEMLEFVSTSKRGVARWKAWSTRGSEETEEAGE